MAKQQSYQGSVHIQVNTQKSSTPFRASNGLVVPFYNFATEPLIWGGKKNPIKNLKNVKVCISSIVIGLLNVY